MLKNLVLFSLPVRGRSISVLVLCLWLVACGGAEVAPPTDAPTEVQVATSDVIDVATSPSETVGQVSDAATFDGIESCAVLEEAINSVYPDLAIARLTARDYPLVFQGGRFWASGCQFDEATDPFLFSSNIFIETYATAAEAQERLESESNNRSSTSTSITGESDYSDGAFIIDDDVFGVKSRQLSYTSDTHYVRLVAGGEDGRYQGEITQLADAVNSQLTH